MQRNGMLVLSIVAFATAAGLFGIRQSLASEPLRKAPAQGETVADLFPTQALATHITPSAHSRGSKAPTTMRVPDLSSGLTYQNDGFLGARQATSQDGRQALTFLWFRNEAAMLAWYEHRVERQIIQPYFPDMAGQKPTFYGDRNPEKNVMVIATLTPNPKAETDSHATPVLEASFDVYNSTGPRTTVGQDRPRGHLVD